MMNHAGLDENNRRKLLCETISTTTKLDNLMVRIFQQTPKIQKHLRTFGETAVAASHDRKKSRTTIEERRKTAVLVGCADDQTGDVYRYIYIKTEQ